MPVPDPAQVIHVPAPEKWREDFAKFSRQEDVVFASFNIMNLNYHVGRFDPNPQTGVRTANHTEPIRPKDEKSIKRAALTLRELGADVILLQEVESKRDLDLFMKEQGDVLQRDYHALLIEGNDGRGIDVAMLVRKDLGLELDYVSHKNMRNENELYPDRDKAFSRDATAMIARIPGTQKPLFIVINTHSKSKRTDHELDPESYSLREAQGHALTDLKLYYEEKYPGVPIIMGGDFNANPNTSSEYIPLRTVGGMKDTMDVSPNPVSAASDDRVTHTFHPLDPATKRELPAHKDQMDALLVNDAGAGLVTGANVHKYYDEATGEYLPSPDRFSQRKKQPSDHRAVKARMSVARLIQLQQSGN